MKCKILTMLVLFCKLLNAQNMPSIQTDRPDQTECPFIVPSNYLQLENGLVYQKTDVNSSEIIAPNILMKFGVNNHFELRLIIEYSLNKDVNNTISGINPVLVGFKTRLFEENGIVPTTSFIAHLAVPNWHQQILKLNFMRQNFGLQCNIQLVKNKV